MLLSHTLQNLSSKAYYYKYFNLWLQISFASIFFLLIQIMQQRKSLCISFPADLNVMSFPWKKTESHSVMSDSLWPHGLQPTRLFCPWDSPGKNTGVGIYSLPWGIFPNQGLNLHLLHCSLSHKGPSHRLPETELLGKSAKSASGEVNNFHLFTKRLIW